MAAARALSVQAGPTALAILRERGLQPADVRMLVGASGGAKWLVLAGLDQAIMRAFVPQFDGPVHLLGSSIGAWRFACYAQRDPLAAIRRFEAAYLSQTYSDKPTRDEITATSRRILADVLGSDGATEIVSHRLFRTHIMAVRARHLAASENRALLAAGLVAAMVANSVSRKALGWFFSRALVHDPRDAPPFLDVDDLPIQRIALSADNVAPAIFASGSIPLVLNGVTPLPGAAPGVYRDGGITDYHFDVPLSTDRGITLYPHFYEHLTPGWFDKRKRGRRPRAQHLERVVLLSPSREFVASLPGGRIPDRHDFRTLDNETRLARWRTVVAESQRLGDELLSLCEAGRIAAVARPFDQ